LTALQLRLSDRHPSRAAIFIDRDGVINQRRENYVLHSWQLVFTPGIVDALRELTELQVPMIVVSNQSAVGRGLMSLSDLDQITQTLDSALAGNGVHLSGYYYCVHKVEDNCSCRKPKPGLIRKAAEDFGFDLSRCVFVGDSATDLDAALAAGCQPVLFGDRPLIEGDRSKRPVPQVPKASSPRDLLRVVSQHLKLQAALGVA
jgi:D-glycero-D-manno-heptose 1,7-bisphosphate phosphatase